MIEDRRHMLKNRFRKKKVKRPKHLQPVSERKKKTFKEKEEEEEEEEKLYLSE